MKISIGNYGHGQPNCQYVEIESPEGNDLRVYFSYSTPVAFYHPRTGLVVSENVYGTTTGKHINWIDGGEKEAKAKRKPANVFALMLDEFEVEVKPAKRALRVVPITIRPGMSGDEPMIGGKS
jgi:hypothetical protein